MNLLSQADGMILEQGLYVLPAAESTNTAYAIDFADAVETGPACVAVNRTLHVGGFEFATLHDDGSRRRDGALGDVKRVVVIL